MALTSSLQQDNYILEYWNDIQTDKVAVSKKIYKTYKKVVQDIENPGRWHYDDLRAKHAVYFIEEYCRHSQGEMGGQKIILETWERAMISTIFGFVDNDGYRKYRRAVWIVGKKNGKSLVASAVGLYMQIADGEMGPEVVSAATTRDQAKKIWEAAKAMVMMSPVLKKRIKPLTGELSSKAFNFGTFKPLSSDYNTLDGLNLHCVLLDELQQWKNGLALYDILARGISARKQPLIFITTTAGTIREDIYDVIYDECELIINGYEDPNGYKDERTIAFIYELDERKEWTDEKCWVKANPGLGTIKNYDILKNEVEKAKENPLLVKNLLCKDFNIRETSTETWLSFEDLNNTATFDLRELKPRYGIGGVDLSSTTDLTNATVIFMCRDNPTIYVLQMYWLPEDLLEQRAKEDKIPYNIWRDMGLLQTTPGNKVHYKFVTDWFLKVQNELDIYIPWIGYDSWSATYFVEEMKSYFGKDSMEPVIQGKKTLSGPMKSLGADLAAKKINYNNSPILKWNLSNVAVDIDKNDNIQPTKGSNQRKRIDGFAGLLNAYVVLERHYEDYINMI
ncbi:terminase large subunit [Paratissierella segnis]|uniref:Terminase large subunit n=1 Tax=Paratissierella segnis TaxID=2763679 RepID=A0A926EXG1_9FIRM|nr:terminase TerL endonuclease subunit [Paratissierella segnis]MBC8588084.1 terminase large subunit [Paratissierella segnis]